MITVSIQVEGEHVITQSATNVGIDMRRSFGPGTRIHYYHLNDGSYIKHRPCEGVAELAMKMLSAINKQP